jgi:hypothetical protein
MQLKKGRANAASEILSHSARRDLDRGRQGCRPLRLRAHHRHTGIPVATPQAKSASPRTATAANNQ